MNLNKVFLIGRLTNDPEVRTTPSGQTVCSFGLATNRNWVDRATNEKKEKAEFHNIILWRRLAEIASQYLTKGSLVLIEGRIQTRNWEDSSRNKRYKTEIIAENIQFGPKSASSVAVDRQSQSKSTQQEEIPIIEENYNPPTPQDETTNVQKEEQAPISDDSEEIDVSKIPF